MCTKMLPGCLGCVKYECAHCGAMITPVRNRSRLHCRACPGSTFLFAGAALPVDLASCAVTVAPSSALSTAECAVCLESLSVGGPIVALACVHMFHAACAARWFAKRPGNECCPLCAYAVDMAGRPVPLSK